MKKSGFFGKDRIQRYRCKSCGKCQSDIPQRPLNDLRVPFDKAVQIVNMLVEGISIRATARLSGVHRDTVLRVLETTGRKCAELHDKTLRNLNCEVIQVDEIWSFCGCKEINVPEDLRGKGIAGDLWTWVAIDAKTKLIPAWHVGNRDAWAANYFMDDLKSRLAQRVQLTSDGLRLYVKAVEDAFGADVDYASRPINQIRSPVVASFCSPGMTIVTPPPSLGLISRGSCACSVVTVSNRKAKIFAPLRCVRRKNTAIIRPTPTSKIRSY
jgi:hypothetical protein